MNDFYFVCREANAVLGWLALAMLAYRGVPLLFIVAHIQWKFAIALFHAYVAMSAAVSAQLLVNHDQPGPTAPATTLLHILLLVLMLRWSQTTLPPSWKRKT